MMKASIQTKLLALCILLVLLTSVSSSVIYYILTKQDKQRESQERIQIAFDIILDDVEDRLNTSLERVREFVSDDILRVTTSSYMQDDERIQSISFISTTLARAADELKRFGQVNSAHRVMLYGANNRLLAVYQRHDKHDAVGVYVVLQDGTDAFLPMDDPAQLTSMLLDRQAVPDTAGLEGISPFYKAELPTTLSANLFTERKQLGIRITAPISHQEHLTGVLLVDIVYTQSVVERYASLSKTAVNFFVGNQLSLGTLWTQTRLESKDIDQLHSCEAVRNQDGETHALSVKLGDQKYYQGRCALKNAQSTVGAITVSLSQEIEKQEVKKILTAVLTISGIVSGLAFGISVIASRKSIRSLQNIVKVIGAAAEGDLRPSAIATTRDEVGKLAIKLNQMIAQLRSISKQVQTASYAVNSSADMILQEMEVLIRHMEQQSTSVDTTTVSIEKIKQFIDTVSRNTSDLLSAAAQILASIQETRASIADVTTSTGSLTTDLHLISASVDQVNHAVKQIAKHTRELEKVAQHTETEIQHINQSLKDVSHNADRAQQLAEETMDAATSGQTSVEASIQGMRELKEVVSNTAQIIREVDSWGERVSSILDIVDEITEQTSLLALNASIISAQAGVHGRGFAVVADEIKELATRTKASMQEIGTLIHELRKKTEEGVKQMTEGIRKTDQEMQLASAVKESFNTILERATRSSNRAADTVQVIQQTVNSGHTIIAQMNSVTDMVSKIRTAIQDQEKDVEQVVAAVENISGLAEQVNRASIEQKRSAEEIERSMEEVTEHFCELSEQTETLLQNSDQIVNAMHTIESTTDQILQNATDISGETVRNLVQQSEVLQKIVNVFKIS
jgi:methyl-accepting chemotaxis protein